jgi:hypothetical protein
MFRIHNLKYKFGNFSHFGNYFNTFQEINLNKYSIYPHFEKELMKSVPTYLLIDKGKLVINMKKYNKKSEKFINKTIFGENNILYEMKNNNDIILTNQKYIITILPNTLFSFFAHENSKFKLFFTSNKSINYYTYDINNNNYNLSSIENL